MKKILPALVIVAAVMFVRDLKAQEPAGTKAVPAAELAAENRDRLIEAYKKEFVFLDNERRALQERIDEVDNQMDREVGRAESRIDYLEGRLLELSRRADNLGEDLQKAEKVTAEKDETEQMVKATLEQALAGLDKYGVSVEDFDLETAEGRERAIGRIFDRALLILGDLGRVRTEKGSFFLEDGTKVDGELVLVGNVAALGWSERGGGTLAPAGGGSFKVWTTKSGQAVRYMLGGGKPPVLPLFLYESIEKMAEQVKSKTLKEHIDGGGFIAWIIIGLACADLLLILARSFFLWRSSSDTERLVKEVVPMVREGSTQKALKFLKPARGAAARVLASTVRNLHVDPRHLEDIISESILHETPFLDRFESSITVFTAVAPLLGLLGTVTGMIATFDVITVYGTGDPKLLSGGISEALITTELGLMIAIPSLLAGSLLSGWANRIKSEMENAALKVTNVAMGERQQELFDRAEEAPA